MKHLLIILCLLAAAQTRVHGPTQVRHLGGGDSIYWYYGTIGPINLQAGQCAESNYLAAGVAPGQTLAPGWPASLPAGVYGIMYAGADVVVVRLCAVQPATIPPLTYSASTLTWR